MLSTAGASDPGGRLPAAVVYLICSLFCGQAGRANPWRATGLEWQTARPPPTHNFEGTPVVTRGPYEYSTEGDGHAG